MGLSRLNLRRFGIFATLFSASIIASAQTGPSGRFDLAGPKIEIQVTRAGKMLPMPPFPTCCLATSLASSGSSPLRNP